MPESTALPSEPLVVVFFIAAEHPMGLPHGLQLFITRKHEPVPWVKFTGGLNFVGLQVWRTLESMHWQLEKDEAAFKVAKTLTVPPEKVKDPTLGHVPKPGGEILGTVMEVATPLLIPASGNVNEAYSNAFDRCLEGLNLFMRSFFAVTSDPRFRPISRQTCRPIVPMTTQDLSGKYGRLGTFLVHPGFAQVPVQTHELNEEQLRRLGVVWQRMQSGDPFAPFIERSRVANREYGVDGDYPSAVVAAYTACEVLLNTALLLMAWEEGKTRDETRPWFELRLDFMNRITREVQPRLGGNWSNPSDMSPMGQLHRLSNLRNQVIHVGYLPIEREAQEALGAVRKLEEFVKQRFAVKRMTYPRTCLLLIGEPGLHSRNAWDERIAAWIEEHAEAEDNWIETFCQWRDKPEVQEN